MTAASPPAEPATATKTVLVVGATGATGRQVVQKLLCQGHNVKVIVRSKERMIDMILQDINASNKDPKTMIEEQLTVTEASISEMSVQQLEEHVKNTDAVVSCLGHNITMSGIWGRPWKLVTESVRKLTQAMVVLSTTTGATAAAAAARPQKFILMGSDGVANPSGTDDIRPFSERFILGLIRYSVPPHSDNEGAVNVLYKELGTKDAGSDTAHCCPPSSSSLEWTVVRPTDLIDGPTTQYTLYPKPLGSLFGAGTARRSTVAQCIVDLILQDELWQTWKFQMPVIHDAGGAAAETSTKELG